MPSETFLHLPAAKRAVITTALLDEFSAHPLSEAKVSRIVVASRIARGSFYVYFTDLFDAYRHVLDTALAQVDAGLERSLRDHPDDTLEVIYAYTADFIRGLDDSPYRRLFAMHWLTNQYELAVHRDHNAGETAQQPQPTGARPAIIHTSAMHQSPDSDAASPDGHMSHGGHAGHSAHAGYGDMPVLVRGRTITDARLRRAALSAAVHESHRTAKDVLGGEPAHTALDRFAALLDLLRAGLVHSAQPPTH
ncbi:TetR/AcrR family transcriptional regulator [Bifidobacterium mongoliense]|uniref:TetR/AcrR family transcriptional regulator n=1 Tax=Bifidobacterium mongoliense TaxID=518643 RepID=UPI0026480240|nr:TetR/AcrR family transcriptional regulator [Bifidobacterium mongoliense]MDN6024612.1 TetR/AcrR family transcriptional regulator [Bifidobacterium mongoliense]MDN6050476.1 TetR/AcrR family transcriptional regulator [Bifidobacterium mongoliense]MDN6719695.1 TetR/AcrR family transcriptional regulator [Bifidobacterium mongoliense]